MHLAGIIAQRINVSEGLYPGVAGAALFIVSAHPPPLSASVTRCSIFQYQQRSLDGHALICRGILRCRRVRLPRPVASSLLI